MRKTLLFSEILILIFMVSCASTYYSQLPSAQPDAYVYSSSEKDKKVATALNNAKEKEVSDDELNSEPPLTDQQQAYIDNMYYQMALLSANQFTPIYYTSDTKTSQQIIAENVDKSRQDITGNRQFINAKTVYMYNEGIIYDIYYNPTHVTSIRLEENEQFINRVLGDPTLWLFETLDVVENEKPYTYLLVRPYNTNIETEMTVFTDKRVYHFRLHSIDGTSQVEINFNYPEKMGNQSYILKNSKMNKIVITADEETATSLGKSVANLNFNYKIKGSASWKPVKVYSDTARTYIQFPNSFLTNSETPVVYLRHNGKDELVNFTSNGINYIVPIILSTNEVLVLKVEKEEILIGY